VLQQLEGKKMVVLNQLPVGRKVRQLNPNDHLHRRPLIDADGWMGGLGGDIFGLLLSDDYNGPNITTDKKKVSNTSNFRVQLDVSHFNPNEIKVRIFGRDLIIDGKTEEHRDDDGFINPSFSRRYTLPDDVDEDKLVCQLSRDYKLLTLEAPRKEAIEDYPQARMVAIENEAA